VHTKDKPRRPETDADPNRIPITAAQATEEVWLASAAKLGLSAPVVQGSNVKGTKPLATSRHH